MFDLIEVDMGFGGVIKLSKQGYILLILLAVIFLYFQFYKSLNVVNNEEISLSYILKTAIQAAQVGGAQVVSTRNNLKIRSKGKTAEGMDDSVTTADFLSHCAMKQIIARALPSVAFISEENNIRCDMKSEDITYDENLEVQFQIPDGFVQASDVTVWIDPLDATFEYTEKLYQYVTTMVCVAIKGEPLVGVIHKPFSKSTSWAVVGFGHSDDLNQQIHETDSKKTKIVISRSHSGTIRQILKKNFKDFELIIAAGAGYKVLKVVDHTADAYLHSTAIKKWDICAGNAILNALGGKMTTKHGKTLTYHNDTDVINKDGLVATLKNHEFFIDKL